MKNKILIVEDEKVLSEAYEMILSAEGYQTQTAWDGKQALSKLESFHPDLILLDLRMPVMGGIDFLKAYDIKQKLPDTRVIVFSNLDSRKEIEEAYSLGADRYMLKAWASPRELIKLVSETLEMTDVKK